MLALRPGGLAWHGPLVLRSSSEEAHRGGSWLDTYRVSRKSSTPTRAKARRGTEILYTDGMLLRDETDARREAVRVARSLIAQNVGHDILDLSVRVEVEDDDGNVLFAVSLRDVLD